MALPLGGEIMGHHEDPPEENINQGASQTVDGEVTAPDAAAEPPKAQTNTTNVKPTLKPFDMSKDGVSQAAAWIARLALSFTSMGLSRAVWGMYLLTLLPNDVMRLVYANLGISLETHEPDQNVCTWEAVCDALRKACSGTDETDQGRLYSLTRYVVGDGKGRFIKMLDFFEQTFLKMLEALPLSVKVFLLCQKIPMEHRARFQYDNGQPWTCFDRFKTNFVAQASLIDGESRPKGQPNKPQGHTGTMGNGDTESAEPGPSCGRV
jgi:hypothetical protein